MPESASCASRRTAPIESASSSVQMTSDTEGLFAPVRMGMRAYVMKLSRWIARRPWAKGADRSETDCAAESYSGKAQKAGLTKVTNGARPRADMNGFVLGF